MKNPISLLLCVLLCLGLGTGMLAGQPPGQPHLEKRGATTELIVDGQPFLMISGELLNSSSSNLDAMKPVWPRLAGMGLNTVVTPLSWELIEPKEGTYDFSLVDGLLAGARESHERIVFLWFGSWKNGTSSYAPVWVKTDTHRFPREVEFGNAVETLSPLGKETEKADAKAFGALMAHLKGVDARDHTVLMMQVENEIGVLGDSRDHSDAANKMFASAVPAELTASLKAHRDSLDPDLKAMWDANGDKAAGTWAEVFGDSVHADEVFMAWHYARYVQSIVTQGKHAYDIPMYVNTWLSARGATPGEFPSGGPEPWVVDVWKAAAPAIDIYSPDLYSTSFVDWCLRYHRNGNPLYMPETRGGAPGAANVFYALGEEAGLGFSPFAIDATYDDNAPLAASYSVIGKLAPLILEHQAKGDIHGFILDQDHSSVVFTMNGITVHVARAGRGPNAATEPSFGMIMATGPDEFLGAGKGFRVTFTPRIGSAVGIGAIEEGTFEDGKWVAGKRLNGDEDEGGKSWLFNGRALTIEKVSLYRTQ